jgi:hypothetical protein
LEEEEIDPLDAFMKVSRCIHESGVGLAKPLRRQCLLLRLNILIAQPQGIEDQVLSDTSKPTSAKYTPFAPKPVPPPEDDVDPLDAFMKVRIFLYSFMLSYPYQ